MPNAISNSSPLIHLAGIRRLDLLREFYDEVLIPPAVSREDLYRQALSAVGERAAGQ